MNARWDAIGDKIDVIGVALCHFHRQGTRWEAPESLRLVRESTSCAFTRLNRSRFWSYSQTATRGVF